MARAFGSRTIVLAALAGDLLIALAKFVAGALSGSSAMLSEGVHSLVDTANSVLLLYGMHRAKQPADADHPFGHGRELYFWSFMVALLVLTLGAGISLYEGLLHLRHPSPLTDAWLSYTVLAVSFAFGCVSWWMALQGVRVRKGNRGYWEAFRRSKDPGDFIVLLSDTAALIGLLLALGGVMGSHMLHAPRADGAASVAIAVVLGAVAILLLHETKGLLIGEPAHPRISESILEIARQERGVRCANGVLTFQMGPDQVVANLSAEFDDGMNADQIEQCVNRIEDRVKHEHADIVALFVKPQSARTWREHTRGLHRSNAR